MRLHRILLFLFVLIQIWCFYYALTTSYSGISIQKNADGRWAVKSFEDTHPSLREQLQVGDIVEQIDGKDPYENDHVRRWRVIDGADRFTVLHQGQRYELSLVDNRVLKKTMLLPWIGGAICLLFAWIVYAVMRHSRSARFLCYVFLNIASIYISIPASTKNDILAKVAVCTGLSLLPVVFLHFLAVFFAEKGNIAVNRRVLAYGYGAVAVLTVSKLSYLFENQIYQVNQLQAAATILFFLAGLVLDFGLLLYIYMKNRRQNAYVAVMIKMIGISLFISFFPFACLSFLPLLLFDERWMDPYYSSWIILIFPITFAYLIVSRQAYDIENFLRRLLFTTVISIVPGAVTVGVFATLLQGRLSLLDVLFGFFIVVILFSAVLYFLEFFSLKFEPVMFPRKHLLNKALRKISRNLGSITSFRELKEIILVDIVQTLQVYGGAIVFKAADHVEIISEGEVDGQEVERLVTEGCYEEHPDYTCIEMNRHEEYTSYLVMTRKRTNALLGLEDMQWLNLIVSYLAVSLENIHLIRKLTMKMQELAAKLPNEEAGQDFIWFRRLMFELQEKERMRIATDLHDTTMQDLFFLKKRLASFMNSAPLEQEVQDHYRSILEFIEIININLRQNCFDLHPHLIQEIGLIGTVQKLVEREQYECPFSIHFQGHTAVAVERESLETKRHLFRMIQELINNAKKHSQASFVRVELTASAYRLGLRYEDDGIGFQADRAAAKEIGAAGIGLEQIKSRTLYLNGTFELTTAVNEGVHITIAIPLREGISA